MLTTAMNNKFKIIKEKYEHLPYMREEQAAYLRSIILDNQFRSLCELGHYHGKSSLYMAAVLEEQGFGHLTTFDRLSTKVNPNILELLEEFDLKKYVTPIVSQEGYLWDMAQRIQEQKGKFDFCYLDGGHSFETTALGFVLIDLVLEKNGIVIFDDYSWTIEEAMPKFYLKTAYRDTTEKQRKNKNIKMVCDIIVNNYNYELVDYKPELDWIVYRKL